MGERWSPTLVLKARCPTCFPTLPALQTADYLDQVWALRTKVGDHCFRSFVIVVIQFIKSCKQETSPGYCFTASPQTNSWDCEKVQCGPSQENKPKFSLVQIRTSSNPNGEPFECEVVLCRLTINKRRWVTAIITRATAKIILPIRLIQRKMLTAELSFIQYFKCLLA